MSNDMRRLIALVEGKETETKPLVEGKKVTDHKPLSFLRSLAEAAKPAVKPAPRAKKTKSR